MSRHRCGFRRERRLRAPVVRRPASVVQVHDAVRVAVRRRAVQPEPDLPDDDRGIGEGDESVVPVALTAAAVPATRHRASDTECLAVGALTRLDVQAGGGHVAPVATVDRLLQDQ